MKGVENLSQQLPNSTVYRAAKCGKLCLLKRLTERTRFDFLHRCKSRLKSLPGILIAPIVGDSRSHCRTGIRSTGQHVRKPIMITFCCRTMLQRLQEVLFGGLAWQHIDYSGGQYDCPN